MRRRRWRADTERAASAHRLEGLADGVFAIVMTLLVLELTVPTVADVSNESVTDALVEMWPEFLIYVLSFLVLGVFWLVHKMVFDSIEAADPPLMWLNVMYLLVTALLPFSTAVVGEYRELSVAAAIYALNVLLAFAAGWAVFAYATRGHRLTAVDLDPTLIKGGNRMGLFYVLAVGAAVAVAFASPIVSYLVIAAIVGSMITATMMGHWESVMIWTTDADEKPRSKVGV